MQGVANPKPITIITGGSEGIGLALAQTFAKAGHDILIVARDQERLISAAQELKRLQQRNILTAAIDLTDPNCAELIARELRQHNVYADILINSAAMGLSGDFVSHNAKDAENLIALNIRSSTQLMQAFLPGMLDRGQGGIINIASLGGMVPGPYQAMYYASKAYLISLTKAVAYEVRSSRVRVCVIAPGPVSTRFHSKMGAQTANYLKLPGTISAERVARSALMAYRLRLTVMVPGILPALGAFCMAIIPDAFLLPLVGWLLKNRS